VEWHQTKEDKHGEEGLSMEKWQKEDKHRTDYTYWGGKKDKQSIEVNVVEW